MRITSLVRNAALLRTMSPDKFAAVYVIGKFMATPENSTIPCRV
jgi:hypothetical protein